MTRDLDRRLQHAAAEAHRVADELAREHTLEWVTGRPPRERRVVPLLAATATVVVGLVLLITGVGILPATGPTPDVAVDDPAEEPEAPVTDAPPEEPERPPREEPEDGDPEVETPAERPPEDPDAGTPPRSGDCSASRLPATITPSPSSPTRSPRYASSWRRSPPPATTTTWRR